LLQRYSHISLPQKLKKTAKPVRSFGHRKRQAATQENNMRSVYRTILVAVLAAPLAIAVSAQQASSNSRCKLHHNATVPNRDAALPHAGQL